jgi:hypothetical protein
MRIRRLDILRAAEAGLTVQEVELAEERARQMLAVVTKTAGGSSDIDQTFALDRKFRLVFIRCHFVGGSGTAALSISADSVAGAAFDARLFTISQAGTGKDVHLRIEHGVPGEPSAWTLQSGDGLRIQWTNPDSGNMTWGLEIGLALAS